MICIFSGDSTRSVKVATGEELANLIPRKQFTAIHN